MLVQMGERNQGVRVERAEPPKNPEAYNTMTQEPQKIANPHKMPRGSAILYPKEGLETGVGAHFSGMTVTTEGLAFGSKVDSGSECEDSLGTENES
jgi:hypothetical protein